jgi:hypothetical protein
MAGPGGLNPRNSERCKTQLTVEPVGSEPEPPDKSGKPLQKMSLEPRHLLHYDRAYRYSAKNEELLRKGDTPLLNTESC